MNKKTSQREKKADALEDAALEGMEILKQYQGPIIGATVLAFVIVFSVAYKTENEEKQRAEAWTSLFTAEQKVRDMKKDEREKADLPKLYEEVRKAHPSSSVTPFALLRQAEALYKKGGREDLEQSKKLLNEFVTKYPQLNIYHDMAKAKIKAIEDELAFAPSWMEKKEEKKEEKKDSKAGK